MTAELDALRAEVAALRKSVGDHMHLRSNAEAKQRAALDMVGLCVAERQQAEATRDAAQAVASRAEERARKAEAERDEWRAVALDGADAVLAARYVAAASWAVAVRNGTDPAAGTGDHEREPGRHGE